VQDYIENIRTAYTKDFTSKDIAKQQIAVATYLIDKLALRAGNEKVLCLYVHLLNLFCAICKLIPSLKQKIT
jgi:DNA topoisomerase IB